MGIMPEHHEVKQNSYRNDTSLPHNKITLFYLVQIIPL
jgi:hypothetical protein